MSRYDIAIIGMGCVFPNARSTQEYWESIRKGDTYFQKMPKRLWDLDAYYSPEKGVPEKSYTTAGSFVEGFEFPFLEYKLPPANMRGIDATQLMTIDATRQALDDAGIEFRSEELTDAITIVGASGVDAFAHSAAFLKRHRFLKKMLPLLKKHGVKASIVDKLDDEMTRELDERGHIWAPSVAAVGAIPSSVSNRVAQVFGVRGMNMTVDAACASSFVAVDTACQALMAGDARIAVAGGADLGTNPPIYVGFSRVDGLSAKGVSNPFDHTADGLVIGEGVGMVVLKRLEDALDDGDEIKSVIRGLGSSSDGAGQAIYAPATEGRAEAFRWALENAETAHSDVQYIEAHATSTIVGDANEYDAISMVYGKDRKNTAPCYLGSVKAQIGHLKAAAGVAGLIKTVLAMENKTIPHMPRFRKLTPGAKLPSDHLVVNNDLLPWEPGQDGMRVGAITTSGFGGVNYHAIIEHGDTYSRPKSRPKVSRELAIVALETRVAGADHVDKFWQNVTSGKDVFSRVNPADHGWEDCFETGPENEKINTHVISKLDDYQMNMLRHKIFPKAVSQIAPTQLLGLDLSDKLLENYGLDLADPKKIGVSLGSMHDDFFPTIFPPMLNAEYTRLFKELPSVQEIDTDLVEECCQAVDAEIKSECPPVTEHTLPGWMTNVTAGRIANRLNLHGPNFIVDSACSSGIAATVPAMYQLMFGNVDMMISGGLNRQLSDTFTSGVCALGAVAKEVARPFDEKGSGYLIGEGGIVFLLKRLADARRDGDDIYGIVHAVGGSSEADTKSMIAPTEVAMARAIRNAFVQTNIKPADIGISDTHGSANELSDIVEARALAAELRPDAKGDPVQITAIKSHIGHLYGGSGAASIVSTIQALRTRTVPGIRMLENVRPQVLEVADRAMPRKGTVKLKDDVHAGGVNSLGLGGANYFAVVTGPDFDQTEGDTASSGGGSSHPHKGPFVRAGDEGQDDIFLCLAESEKGFAEAVARALQQDPVPNVITEGSEVVAKMAVSFDSPKALKTKLGSALKMLEGGHDIKPLESQGVFTAVVPEEGENSALAFCFPGQGVHYIGMGKVLYDSEPIFREVVDTVHELAMKEFKFDLLGHIYGDEEDEGIKKNLGTLVGAQTSLFAIEVGMARVLESRGITPDVMVGHSFGEISALTFADVWDLETAYKAVTGRIKAAEAIIKGGGPALGMMSLISSEDQRDAILDLVGDKVVLTNINAPGRFVLAGEKSAVERTVKVAESFGTEARLLPIGAAFHSQYMEPARKPFRDTLARLPCNPPRFPILSTITGEYIDQDGLTSEALADHLSSQLITRLNLPREINRLYGEGTQHFIEVGPGWSMTKMISAILDEKHYRAVPTLHPKVGDEETFRRARAFLMALDHIDSAAGRQNIPGMFSPDFIEYMESFEPAFLALIEEVHERYLDKVKSGSRRRATPRTSAATAKRVEAVAAPGAVVKQAKTDAVAPVKAGGGGGAGAEQWIKRLREKLVATTGYPPEMLELDLDLEADLGVDSVQRAEIWVALTTEHNLDSEARPTGARTIAQLAGVLSEMEGGVGGETVEAEVAAQPEPAAPQAAASGGEVEVWIERLREKLVETTGYPPEMLELDLDLEADLGVDSVQRAEIWVALTTEHKLDAETRPTGARTIAQLAAVLDGMASGGAPAAPVQPEQTAPLEPKEAPAAAPVADSAPAGGVDTEVWIERLREKLVETTGYPPEMLELDLDLEADLGVDSVQRAEIWVALTTEHKLDAETRPTGARTIAQLAAVLGGMAAGGNDTTTEEEDAAGEKKEPRKKPVPFDDAVACRLFVGGYQPAGEEDLESFDCSRVLIITADGDTEASKIKRRLGKRDIEVSTVRTTTIAGMATGDVESILNGCDTVIYVAHSAIIDAPSTGAGMHKLVDEETARLYTTFRIMTPVLDGNPRRIVFPVSMDGTFGASKDATQLGAFPSGFVRSFARELPDSRVVLLDSGDMGWADAIDQNIGVVPTRLELGTSSYGPVVPNLAKVSDAFEYNQVLEKGDLVLVTGGARGIVFECVYELAMETGARLLLTGRTALPTGRPDWFSTEPGDIDRVIREMEIDLVRSQGMKLPEAKRVGATARSQWEVSRNLDRLEAAGVEVSYEKCDVSDSEAFGELIQRVSREDKFRGVVHGAGVQKAKLVTELTDDAIRLTLGAKLSPFFTMLDNLDWSKLRLFSAFGSIAGLFGNSGQTDYGLANDMLAWMVSVVGVRHPHIHAQTVEWTAWVGTGMVSEEEGKRFEQAGLTPLDVETGVGLYMEALNGCAHSRMSVFNSSAGFASGRASSDFPAAASPRARLVEMQGGEGNPTARFSIHEDVYLNQHLVKLEPVVPGTFVTEIFAEASEGSSNIPTDIQFRRPLQLRGDDLEVEVVEEDGNLMILPVDRPDLGAKGLANLAYSTCTLGPATGDDYSHLVISKKDYRALIEEGAATGATFYDMLDSKFSSALKTGPVFRGIRSILERGDMFFSAVTITSEASSLLEVPGEFVFNPVLADMAVQVGAAWAMLRHDTMEIPFEIGALNAVKPLEGRHAIVICKAHEITDERTEIDLVVREPDGRLVLAMDRLVLKTIMRGDG